MIAKFIEHFEYPKFEGKELKFPDQAKGENLHGQYVEKFWRGEGNPIYELEKQTIINHIREELDKLFRSADKSKEFPNVKLQSLWESLEQTIRQVYCRERAVDLSSAEKKYVEKTLNQTFKVGIWWNVILIFFVLIEIAVLTIMAIGMAFDVGYIDYYTLFSGILQGIFLAIGAVFLGYFLGIMSFNKELYRNGIERNRIKSNERIGIPICIIIILVISSIRGYFGGAIAFILPIILASIIMLLELTDTLNTIKRRYIAVKRTDYYISQAPKIHEINIQQYKQIFFDEAKRIADKYGVKLV